MIRNFRDKWLSDFFIHDIHNKKIPADATDRLFRKLQLIDDAMSDQDLRVPPSNHFEKLSGKFKGWHSIRVTGFWRLIFRWDGTKGEASDLYLDPHDYKNR